MNEFKFDTIDHTDPRNLPERPRSSAPTPEKKQRHNFDEFFRRQSRYENVKAENKARRWSIHNEIGGRECTFEPKFCQELLPGGNTMSRLTKSKDYEMYEAIKAECNRSREEAALQECTFKPKINASKSVANRVYAPRDLSTARTRSEKNFQQICPFKPKILGVKPRMGQASIYTKEAAFDRLYSKEFQTPAHSTAADSRTYSLETSMSRAEKQNCLNDFLARQQKFLEEKQNKLQQRLREPAHQPKLCQRSTLIAKGTFEERCQDIAKRRSSNPSPQPGGKFKPKISALGRASRQRSIEELCYGDAERKQIKIEQLRKLYESEKARNFEATFVTYPSSIEGTSKLRLRDASDSYLDRIRDAKEKRACREASYQLEREARELAECTHAPTIHEAPVFVKRVAHSMRLLRAQRALDDTDETAKADWR